MVFTYFTLVATFSLPVHLGYQLSISGQHWLPTVIICPHRAPPVLTWSTLVTNFAPLWLPTITVWSTQSPSCPYLFHLGYQLSIYCPDWLPTVLTCSILPTIHIWSTQGPSCPYLVHLGKLLEEIDELLLVLFLLLLPAGQLLLLFPTRQFKTNVCKMLWWSDGS
jgi:hypothetical protein